MTIEPTTFIIIISSIGGMCLAIGWLVKLMVEKMFHHRPKNGNGVKKVEKDLKEDIEALAQQVALGATHNREDFAAVRADISNIKETMVSKTECQSHSHKQDIASIWTAIDGIKQSTITNEMCKELRKAVPH